MIAGLASEFIPDGGQYPFDMEFIGKEGGAGVEPDDIFQDIKALTVPQSKTLPGSIREYLIRSTYVSSYPQQIIVELQLTEGEMFIKMVAGLPGQVSTL